MSQQEGGQEASRDKEADAPTPSRATSVPSAENGVIDSDQGMEALLRESDYSFRRVRRGETVEGTIVRVDPDEVLVDIGLKSEGVISGRELWGEDEEGEQLHPGDRALVYVIQPEGQEGHAILSLRRARVERSWREIEELYHRGEIIEAPVVDFNKGGLIVDVKGVRGFVPVSQVLDLRNVSRQEGENDETAQALSEMKGRRLPLKIIEINRGRNRLILSERSAVQERRTQRKDELIEGLEAGQVRRGVVSNITNFGAFVDLGGADGLVHVSELSYNRVNHPGEILQVGQEVDVFVLSVDRDTKKIALSLKRALPDPWDTVEERYRVGQVVPAVITKLAKFGAFAQVEEGLEGLIHLTELTNLPVQDPSQVVHEGERVNAKIISINSQRRRLGLSVRQAAEPAGYVDYLDTVEAPTSPFADHDFGAFGVDEETFDVESSAPASDTGTVSPEDVPDAGVQDTPAAQPEPEDLEMNVNGSAADVPSEAPPAPEATMQSTDEDEEPVASASGPGSSPQ